MLVYSLKNYGIIFFALPKAYERIIEYVASFVDFLETHTQHNKYFFSRISSSALLYGHVSLVRRRSCVTPALPTPPRCSDLSRAEIKRRERNSTIKLKRNQTPTISRYFKYFCKLLLSIYTSLFL